jgi:putative transposase
MKFRFMETQRSAFGVGKMCRCLGISRSGYYAWRSRGGSRRRMSDLSLLVRIRQIHRQSRQTYGCLRITAELKAEGVGCSKNRVARIMKENQIQVRRKKKFKVTTQSGHGRPVPPNRLGDDRQVHAPDRVWVSDLTYIWTREGWLYLAVIIDLYNRQVVGWSAGARITHVLVVEALRQALKRRRPAPGLIFHSDRGRQYIAKEVVKLMDNYGLVQSMGRKGNCFDNAEVESFFHTLKTEWINWHDYETRREGRQSLFDYIDLFYNCSRRHSSLRYLSPMDFEKLFWESINNVA